MSGTLPLIMTSAGPVPTPPATLNAALLAGVQAIVPNYASVIPGGLIEDISSTCTGALVAIDQARVDAVNDVTPLGANAFVINALGQQAGVAQGSAANASVYVTFSGSAGAIGYSFPPGFLVSDGTNQYALQDGGVIQSNGSTGNLYAVATNSGTFAIPANTVTEIASSIASPYAPLITVTNPEAGISATSAQTVQSYRSDVLQAGKYTVSGTPALLKTLLYAITGVQQQLVAVRAVSPGWQIICGGGDSYAVANAVLQAGLDISTLQGSALAITAMTNANPVVITTNLNNNFVAGNTFTVTGASPSGFNTTYTVASATATTITTTTDGSAFGTYTGGATFSPNPRNVSATVFQNPDSYTITYVNPPQQIVTVAATWNTTLSNFTAGTSVNQLAVVAMQSYINSIPVGNPINLLDLTNVFQEAIASVLSIENLTTLTFAVTINGTSVSPSAGTSIIASDPESYFYCSPTGATSVQG